jgi:conjugal transfer pilus assembly protein TraK
MFVAMAGEIVPAEIDVRPVGRDVRLWKESRFVLERLYVANSLVGERYLLTNVSAAPMVLAEQEFYRDGVRGVAVELHQLRPGQSTLVYVVRDRADSE